MRVQDLIDELKYMNPEAEVHFSYNYGDHWRTQVAPTVDRVETGFVKYSDYHRMHKLVDDEDFDCDEETGEPIVEGEQVVLIG